MNNLVYNGKIVEALPYASASTSRNGSGIDVKGYQTICIIVKTATIAAGAVTTYAVTGSNDNSTFTAITGLSYSPADTFDDGIVAFEIVNPTYRYYRVECTKATAAAAESAVAILRQTGTVPVTQPATTIVKIAG